MRDALAILLVSFSCAVFAAERLQGYGADPAATTVSGLSSGGYMAVQFHIAHSMSVKGAGVLAAGPFYCAQGSVLTARYNCMNPSTLAPLPPLAALTSKTDALASLRAIDAPSNLAQARVWLFSGTQDRTVEPPVVESLRRYYEYYVPAANIVLITTVPAGHAMVTAQSGQKCEITEEPFINPCGYDAAGQLLAHLYGQLSPPAHQQTGRLVQFDQKEFVDGDAYGISMADTGYAYVPAACERERCRIHVALHGCRQSVEAIGERFVREAGYNRWADVNRLVVLYPQTIARNSPGANAGRWSNVFNPRGCWDWWGYTGPDYHLKSGRQIRALKAMVDRVATARR